MSKALAMIAARGGSKRIPRKNIKEFLGEPIIRYSIEAALSAGCFDEVMVSTDSKEIADIALSLGAAVPFLRSERTSDDYATTADVIEEVLEEYKKSGRDFEFCCCIYPTAPFITAKKLRESYAVLQKGADSVLPIVRFSYPIQRAFKVDNSKLVMIWPENLNARSQDLTPTYHDAGQFYWVRVERFLKDRKIFTDNCMPIIVPESEVQDIDNEEDWKIAEMKFRVLRDNMKKESRS